MNKKSSGFTLIELIVVIAILGIIAALAVPRLAGFRSKVEESVCAANANTVQRIYSAFLIQNNIDHEDSIFNQFIADNFDEICPTGGVIGYEGGKVKCSVHSIESEGEEDEEPGKEVPWLCLDV